MARGDDPRQAILVNKKTKFAGLNLAVLIADKALAKEAKK